MTGVDEHGGRKRPGIGERGFVPLPPPSPYWSNLPGRVVLRETPSGIVMATTRRPMVIMAVLLAAIGAAFGAALVATGPHPKVVVVGGVLAMVLGGGVPALAVAATWRRMGAEPPILVEHLHEGAVELSRPKVRVPSKQIAAIQSASGWVVKPHDEGSDALYVSQLLAIVRDEGDVSRRLLIASVPHELPGESKRLARRLAAYLGVPHEHIQVRVRGGVQWDDLFSVRSGADAARA